MKTNHKEKFIAIAIISFLFVPQLAFAHEGHSVFAQLIHSITHAHHAFGGLLIIVLFVSAIKLRQKFIKKVVKRND